MCVCVCALGLEQCWDSENENKNTKTEENVMECAKKIFRWRLFEVKTINSNRSTCPKYIWSILKYCHLLGHRFFSPSLFLSLYSILMTFFRFLSIYCLLEHCCLLRYIFSIYNDHVVIFGKQNPRKKIQNININLQPKERDWHPFIYSLTQ